MQLPTKRFLIDKLPVKLRNIAYRILIKLGIIRKYGHAVLTVYDKNGNIKCRGEGFNLIVDIGKGELGDLMIGETNNRINNMNIGTDGTDTSADMEDLVAPAEPEERLAIASGGRFRTNLILTFSVLIGSEKYNRPVTIREMAIYFDPLATGKMFARAVIDDVTLGEGDAARADYEVAL